MNRPVAASDPGGLDAFRNQLAIPGSFNPWPLVSIATCLFVQRRGAAERNLVIPRIARAEKWQCQWWYYELIGGRGGATQCPKAVEKLAIAITARGCEVPLPRCVNCPPSQYAALTSTGVLKICWNNMCEPDATWGEPTVLCNSVYHELIHKYQGCYPEYWQTNDDCVNSLRIEYQAYFCDGSCRGLTPYGCFLRTLSSACDGHCEAGEILNGYDNVMRWLAELERLLGGNICQWPWPHEWQWRRKKAGLERR
jgi:hypothetical protein